METLDYSIFPEKPVVYATFWTRFAAVFIDGVIVGVAGGVINYLLFRDNFVSSSAFSIVIRWLYDAFQESSPAMATLGKKAMRVKVTDLNGGRISFGQATGRHFGKYISGVILCIGYFMMLWDHRRQTLHDRMAGTLVISED
jgi:uncharacterized RDD family membrane protein YckC